MTAEKHVHGSTGWRAWLVLSDGMDKKIIGTLLQGEKIGKQKLRDKMFLMTTLKFKIC